MKNTGLKSFLFKIFIFGMIVFPLVSSADPQILVQEEEIGFEIIPENPEPYDEVTINLNSYATDLDKAIISWQNSAGFVQSGIGKKSITFQAPGPDSLTYFDITISPVGQTTTIRKRIVINPSDIDLMWESVDALTPPFYKGKALPTIGGVLKVVAVPNSNTITSGIGSIDYTWKNNNDTIEEVSGYNRNSYIFKNSLFDKTSNIEVQASSVSGNYNASKKIEISTFNPVLNFYKKSPTDGILFNIATNNDYIMTEDQATFVAYPYYLATKGNEGFFDYKWIINDEEITTPNKKSEITIRPTSRDGYIDIGLTIENMQELFQKVTNNFIINL